MTRPLLEWLVRHRVRQQANIVLLDGCRVQEIVAADGVVAGVRFEPAGGGATTLEADFVVDASGRGSFCLGLLEAMGRGAPPQTEIGVDVGYATAIFAIPDDAPSDWKKVMHIPMSPQSSRGAFLFPIEGRRWIVALGGRGEEKPADDIAGFMAFAQQLRTSTLGDALRTARLERDVIRFAFPASVRRHYAALDHFPRGLLPVADAICLQSALRPGHGGGGLRGAHAGRPARRIDRRRQGPARGARAGLLCRRRRADRRRLGDVGPGRPRFSADDGRAPQGPGSHPQVQRGVEPCTKLMTQVQHLMMPRSALREPALAARVMAELTAG
ncbi:MAG: hypothetical protein EOP82_11400 [Variovorax sp.]|nr:MAG: hypothetical protein EOP82_11400 [Variovorax sp.]